MFKPAIITFAVLIFALVSGPATESARAASPPETAAQTRLSREELQALRLALSDAKERGFSVDEASAKIYSEGEDIIVHLYIEARIEGEYIRASPFGSAGYLGYTIRHGSIVDVDIQK
ncbi:hypothetical protein ABAC460_18890 [Asticcacaulis sp. AC460]|uniref:hypothetical protein n=1 Tax=Asticcacaulis sp. AC460 TaxID=1282360 RepID=UPI0003C407D9|nr:hypothetical protein [Asticcacaulis sp. AC460]ESQ87742.1 hypothetical protein ABAC460_18890 [Asticcacaulis sp. AC460]